jgi:hypothetical protein
MESGRFHKSAELSTAAALATYRRRGQLWAHYSACILRSVRQCGHKKVIRLNWRLTLQLRMWPSAVVAAEELGNRTTHLTHTIIGIQVYFFILGTAPNALSR